MAFSSASRIISRLSLLCSAISLKARVNSLFIPWSFNWLGSQVSNPFIYAETWGLPTSPYSPISEPQQANFIISGRFLQEALRQPAGSAILGCRPAHGGDRMTIPPYLLGP